MYLALSCSYPIKELSVYIYLLLIVCILCIIFPSTSTNTRSEKCLTKAWSFERFIIQISVGMSWTNIRNKTIVCSLLDISYSGQVSFLIHFISVVESLCAWQSIFGDCFLSLTNIRNKTMVCSLLNISYSGQVSGFHSLHKRCWEFLCMRCFKFVSLWFLIVLIKYQLQISLDVFNWWGE